MTDELKTGDRVEWNFGRGKARGKVKKKLTSPTDVGGRRVTASKDDPRYLVETDSGKQAAHKPAALRKVTPTT